MRRIRPKKGRCIFPGYKWCGPGCSGPGRPINAADACCRAHDLCLESGRSKCLCDRAFLDCLRPLTRQNSRMGREASFMYKAIRFRTTYTCRARY